MDFHKVIYPFISESGNLSRCVNFIVPCKRSTLGSLAGSRGNRAINQKLKMEEKQLRPCWKDIQERIWFMRKKVKVDPNWRSGASL